MAYMLSLSTRRTIVNRRFSPFSYFLHDSDERRSNTIDDSSTQQRNEVLLQKRSFGSSFSNPIAGYGSLVRDNISPHHAFFPGSGLSFCRFMSTGEVADKIGLMSEVADVFIDGSVVEAAVNNAPAVSEVAVAATGSFLPIQALQYLIDSVHSFTGLNWWSSIMLTTFLIRSATLPLLINQLKATSKLTLMRPRLEELKEGMQNTGMEPDAVAKGQKEMQKLFKEYGVNPFTPLKGLLFQGPVFVCFFLAISNMAEKMPSFKTGGPYWFMDLSTPDSFYILPILTGLSFLVTVECNMQEGMEGNPAAGTIKNVSRGFAALSVPLTMNFPKAIFCYWVTSNLFSLIYGMILRVPGVKDKLGIPKIPLPPPSTVPQKSFSFLSAMKEYAQKQAAAQHAAKMKDMKTSLPPPVEQSKTETTNRRIPSSSVLSQRVRSLEKQVKGRKKNKKL